MEWKNTDPREVYSRRNIVILIPIAESPSGKREYEATTGYVETKHGYFIYTNWQARKHISAVDEWPQHWLWINAPE